MKYRALIFFYNVLLWLSFKHTQHEQVDYLTSFQKTKDHQFKESSFSEGQVSEEEKAKWGVCFYLRSLLNYKKSKNRYLSIYVCGENELKEKELHKKIKKCQIFLLVCHEMAKRHQNYIKLKNKMGV